MKTFLHNRQRHICCRNMNWRFATKNSLCYIKLRDAYRACCKHLFMSCVKPRFFVQFLKFKRFLRYYKFISHGSEDTVLEKKNKYNVWAYFVDIARATADRIRKLLVSINLSWPCSRSMPTIFQQLAFHPPHPPPLVKLSHHHVLPFIFFPFSF